MEAIQNDILRLAEFFDLEIEFIGLDYSMPIVQIEDEQFSASCLRGYYIYLRELRRFMDYNIHYNARF